jgi:hypothetical protein
MGDPKVTSVADIKNDQGRKVKVRWNRSGGDDAGATMNPVTDYVVLRRDDAPPALTAGKWLDSGWTEVGSAHAFGLGSYAVDVPTIGDSTVALGQYLSVYKVRAVTRKPAVYFHVGARQRILGRQLGARHSDQLRVRIRRSRVGRIQKPKTSTSSRCTVPIPICSEARRW